MNDYLERIQALIQLGDKEAAHSAADRLLCDALLSLRTQATPELAEQITLLVDSFNTLEKWVA